MCDIIIDTQYGVISDLRIDMMMMVVVLCCSSVVVLELSSSSISFFIIIVQQYNDDDHLLMLQKRAFAFGRSKQRRTCLAAPVENSSRLTEVRHRT